MNKINNKQLGFTLVEMMVTIVIAAILMMAAIPSYTHFIKRNTVESLQSRFAAAVITARTEAASRNVTTTLCASSDGISCAAATDAATAWSGGWIVFTDVKSDQVVTTSEGDEVLLVYKQPSADYPVKFQNESAAALIAISFTNQGFTKDNVRAFATLCEPTLAAEYARGFNIERSGRVMKSVDGNNDNVYERTFDNGSGGATTAALSCN